ncbi:NOL1/NOP2/sun family putative RNA methylase [Candidatus Woesearchaeota archaeon]|nr:NOL1/NOP2/sun family putative RNA methylase [Candidatus Woesearchaeota archaeon]
MITIKGIEIKEKFKEHYEKLTDWDEFIKYSLTYLRRSIRVNTLKISVGELKKRLEKDWELTPIPWCKEGFWIEHKGSDKRRDIGNLIEHQLGYFYVQEAASMIPPLVLNPKPGELVLDMAAAPGSKASQIAQYMENKGVLIANDYKGIRIAPLGINLQRMGITNTIITLQEGRHFKGFQFDKILLDAPCSGTGTIRKSLKTLKIWNLNSIKRLAGTQRQLIKTAFNNLKPCGTLVYSTCSCEVEENEAIIDWLLNEYPNAKLKEIKLDIKRSQPFLEYEDKIFNPSIKKCLRIWPQDNDTEGFFVAKIENSE